MSTLLDDSAQPIVPAAERTLRLIELLIERPEGWTPQELLLELDLSRSSLYVLLRALKALGYVEQTGKRGRYTAGPRLRAWRAPQAPSLQDLLAAFYQECETAAFSGETAREARETARETLALVLPVRGGYQVAAQVEGSAQVRSVFTTGQTTAELPAAGAVLDPLPPAEIAAHGYSLNPAGDALHLALPVCRDGHTPEAAVLLSAPAFRWDGERLKVAYLDGLREMAAHLSYRLGAPFYAPYRGQPRETLQATALLDADEMSAFLRGPYTARLACIRPDGKPHVIPVWQEWDGKDFYIIAWQGSQWAEYVQANANVSLTIDEPWAPLRRVVVSGCASAYEATPADLDRLLNRMTRRYLGRSAAAGLSMQVQRAFRVRPEALRGWQGLLKGEKAGGTSSA